MLERGRIPPGRVDVQKAEGLLHDSVRHALSARAHAAQGGVLDVFENTATAAGGGGGHEREARGEDEVRARTHSVGVRTNDVATQRQHIDNETL